MEGIDERVRLRGGVHLRRQWLHSARRGQRGVGCRSASNSIGRKPMTNGVARLLTYVLPCPRVDNRCPVQVFLVLPHTVGGIGHPLATSSTRT